jgi:N-acetylneuraminate synthase
MINFRELTKPYLIAEIGINHNGNLQIAKKLIDATFACSWDCAKFQKRSPDKCVPEEQKRIIKQTPWGGMTYLEYKHRMEFGEKEFDLIDEYCKAKPLDWTMSIWDIDSLDFATQYNVPFLKIPSSHITNKELLKKASLTSIPIVASTGMSSIEEIDSAVNVLEKYASQYVILHCTSSYPAKLKELNLLTIPKLKERYKCVVGYSGHEYGLDSTTIAVSLGAMVIERHITLDHSMWGTDQCSSIEIQGMDKLYKQVHSVEAVLGDGIKKVYKSEKNIVKKLRGT